MEELEEWVQTKVEAWAHGVRTLAKIYKRYPQSAYSGLGMSIQLEWHYLQRNVPEVGSLMGPIEDSLREAFFLAIFRGEEVSANIREILGNSVKHGGLGIPDPRMSAECAYNTSKAASEVLVGSLLGGIYLNYVAHKGCVCRASSDRQKQRDLAEKAVILRRKELAGGVIQNRLRWATENGDWLTAIPHRLNVTDLSREEFQDNLIPQYGILTLNLPTDCDGCGKKFLVPHALS